MTKALTSSQVEMIQSIKAKIDQDPNNLKYQLELVDTVFSIGKIFPGLYLLDRFELKRVTEESYHLRNHFCDVLIGFFDPEKVPLEFKQNVIQFFEVLKDNLPDAMVKDAHKAYKIYQTFHNYGLHDEIETYFLHRAAQLKHADAQATLGYCYAKGIKLSAHPKKAFMYTLKSALQNNKTGLNNLGSLYFEGIGTPKNVEKAYTYMKQAFDLGDRDSCNDLGLMLYEGLGVQADQVAAHKLWLLGKRYNSVGCDYYLQTYFPTTKEH